MPYFVFRVPCGSIVAYERNVAQEMTEVTAPASGIAKSHVDKSLASFYFSDEKSKFVPHNVRHVITRLFVIAIIFRP